MVMMIGGSIAVVALVLANLAGILSGLAYFLLGLLVCLVAVWLFVKIVNIFSKPKKEPTARELFNKYVDMQVATKMRDFGGKPIFYVFSSQQSVAISYLFVSSVNNIVGDRKYVVK